MSPATDDATALLALVPEGSPATELIEAVVNNPDDPDGALRAILASWAAGSEAGEGSA